MRFRVLIADDVDPAAVLKRGVVKLREVVIVDNFSRPSIGATEMRMRRIGNLLDAERVVWVWPK